METVLVVVRPFAGRAVGDVINDPKQMQALLGGEYAMALVRVARPSEDAKAAPPATAAAVARPEHADLAATERRES